MKQRKWRAEEERAVAEALRAAEEAQEHVSYVGLAKQLGRHPEAVRNKARRMDASEIDRLISSEAHGEEEVEVFGHEDADEEDIDQLWEAAKKRNRRAVAKATTENLALIRIVTDKPIALSISSDWHIDFGATDLEALEEYASAISRTPGAYALMVGDVLNNPIKWEKATRDVHPAFRLAGHLIGKFGLKLLGMTDGNHDAWSRAAAGLDAVRWLADRGRIHYAPDELVYVVEIVHPRTQEVTAQYVIATRHKYRRHSNLNFTHACWRWLEDNLNDWPKGEDGGTLLPDILAIGDNHVAAVESRAFRGGQRWAARMGPWQIGSSFGRMLGFTKAQPTAPTFILYPSRERPIFGHEDYAYALDILAKERADAAA